MTLPIKNYFKVLHVTSPLRLCEKNTLNKNDQVASLFKSSGYLLMHRALMSLYVIIITGRYITF